MKSKQQQGSELLRDCVAVDEVEDSNRPELPKDLVNAWDGWSRSMFAPFLEQLCLPDKEAEAFREAGTKHTVRDPETDSKVTLYKKGDHVLVDAIDDGEDEDLSRPQFPRDLLKYRQISSPIRSVDDEKAYELGKKLHEKLKADMEKRWRKAFGYPDPDDETREAIKP